MALHHQNLTRFSPTVPKTYLRRFSVHNCKHTPGKGLVIEDTLLIPINEALQADYQNSNNNYSNLTEMKQRMSEFAIEFCYNSSCEKFY